MKKSTNYQYRNYLKSHKWLKKKLALFEKRGKKCELCGCEKNIEVHHLTYIRIYNEIDSDLMILCRTCHEKQHDINNVEKVEYKPAPTDGMAKVIKNRNNRLRKKMKKDRKYQKKMLAIHGKPNKF